MFWYHLDFPIVIHVLKIKPNITKLELNYLSNIGKKTWLNIKKDNQGKANQEIRMQFGKSHK